MPHCPTCGRVEYDCTCDREGECDRCGKLADLSKFQGYQCSGDECEMLCGPCFEDAADDE